MKLAVSYTHLPRTAKSFNESMNLSLEGIGATLQSEEDETSIKSLVPGAPVSYTHLDVYKRQPITLFKIPKKITAL